MASGANGGSCFVVVVALAAVCGAVDVVVRAVADGETGISPPLSLSLSNAMTEAEEAFGKTYDEEEEEEEEARGREGGGLFAAHLAAR